MKNNEENHKQQLSKLARIKGETQIHTFLTNSYLCKSEV